MRLFLAATLVAPSLLSGCALHPLPEDVARITTVDIVRQIRCEARKALEENAVEERYQPPSEQKIKETARNDKRLAQQNSIFELITSIQTKNIAILNSDAYVRTRHLPSIGTADDFDAVVKLSTQIRQDACELTDDPSTCAQAKPPRPTVALQITPAPLPRTPAPRNGKQSLAAKITTLIKENYLHHTCIVNDFYDLDKSVNDLVTFVGEAEKKAREDAIKSGKDEAEAEAEAIAAATKWATIRSTDTRRRSIRDAMECFRYKNRFYQACPIRIKDFVEHKQLCHMHDDNDVNKRLNKELLDGLLNKCGQNAKWICEGGLDKDRKLKLDNRDEERARLKIVRAGLLERFRDTAIGYDFDFKITDKDLSSIGLDFSLPFSHGTFSFGTSASEEKTRFRTRTFSLAEAVPQLLADTKNCVPGQVNWRYPIAGEIGLVETVKTYLGLTRTKGFPTRAKQKKGNDDAGKPKMGSKKDSEFSDTLEFTTELMGSVAPVLSLNQVKNSFRLVKATPKVTGTRKDVHKVVVTFVEADKVEDEIDPKELPESLVGGTSRFQCSNNECLLYGKGVQFNYVPLTPNFSGTIQCNPDKPDAPCTIQSDAPVGKSATDKALDILERRRNQDSLRDIIREELGTK